MKPSLHLKYQKRIMEAQIKALRGKLTPEQSLKLNQWLTQLRKQLRKAERKEAA